ncbi:MAG: LL-diaminopimelate aminotransferase [Elusimicrobia bacterium RIFCSPLOWO2_01_FULL_60_11]|nr:MAG: LL-diaminopimelate aminotransferase [Elusimicrobia bacterium RIFCSPLOWO2_01_FULL_60_11]
MAVEFSRRLAKLPPYPFAEINRKKKQAIAEGKDVISFGVGDPDQPTPGHIVKAAQAALENPKYHHYPFDAGLSEFRKAVSQWYASRFNVTLDPDTQVRACIGSKDGLSHAHFALLDPGDVALMPDPGYPVYATSTIFAGGKPYALPLKEKNDFLPDLEAVPKAVLQKTKILFLNSPGNPTSAVADGAFFEKAVRMAKKYNFVILHDAAYSEIYFENPPISFLSVPGAADVGVEYHSLSKTYNMTGWRIGWYCGNASIVGVLGSTKENFDSGVFEAVQIAGVSALTSPQDCVRDMRKLYKERRDLLCDGLKNLGWKFRLPEASFYIWVQTPKGYTSNKTVEKLIDDASLMTIPGSALGKHGEGYIRFALTVPKERIQAALSRLAKIRW